MQKFLILAVVGLMLSPAFSARAEEPTGVGPNPTTPEQNIVSLCEAIVDMSKNNLSTVKIRHTDNVERISSSIDKLQQFVNKAIVLGFDTSALSADIATLQTLLSELEVDYQASYDHLVSMTQVDCQTMTSEEQDAQIQNAKSLQTEIKKDIRAIQELRLTIIDHIEKILSQITAAPDESAS